jgi:hypothetical protein
MKRPKVIELTMTCGACPSQWEGKTAKGQYTYIRLRHGFLRAEVSGETIFSCGMDGYDGVMETETMMDKLSGVLKFKIAPSDVPEY